jgi:ligand-binding SRPBCC domain-containing protein
MEPEMPLFESVQFFARPAAEVFDFLCQTANLVRVSPPELHMTIVEGPARIQLGSRLVAQARRWGITQRLVSEVTAYEPNVSFVDSQVQGPFKKWVHRHILEEADGGTRMIDRIDYEPPGGLLGLVMTAGMIERELRWVFDHRRQALEKLLGT